MIEQQKQYLNIQSLKRKIAYSKKVMKNKKIKATTYIRAGVRLVELERDLETSTISLQKIMMP